MSPNVDQTNKKPFQRLPKHVVPLLYDVSLKPDLVNFVFTGNESIHVKVNNQTNEIVLNVRDIDIIAANFQPSEPNNGAITGSIEIDKETEKASIRFNQFLKPGDQGYLNLAFQGALNDKMAGFYRSRYKSTATGEERFAAITQLAATDARRVFPCWDEPAIKARFKMTITAPRDRLVLSNTMAEREEVDPNDENLKIVTFKTTPIMSTYLVAIVVGEYEYLEAKAGANGTLVRVFTPIGKKRQAEFALDIATRSLTYLEEYFKIPYPLEKLDHVPVADFAYGAMENWGLITYRETNLLIDRENTSLDSKQNTARVIAHETAHQWFGNLVTMEWWTHLWLNEGFASFMQYLVVDIFHPEFEFWKQFSLDSTIFAFTLDASHRSHPIEVSVNAPDEVNAIFDAISYHKGACVIRMCYNWIGHENFRTGMADYLTEHSYGNAATEDLWKALEKSSQKPVEKVMSNWTKQMGYPLIDVSVTYSEGNAVVKMTQERFTIDGKLTDLESKALWMVPISANTSKNPEVILDLGLMTEKTMEITLSNVLPEDWIKLNPSMIRFYRVNYSSDMAVKLNRGIKSKTLGPVDRLQIIDDLWSLYLIGKVNVDQVFSTLQCYEDEDDYIPWAGVIHCLKQIDTLLSYTNQQTPFRSFGRKLLAKIFEKMGFDKHSGESHTKSLLRSNVLGTLVSFRDERVVEESKKRYQDHCRAKLLPPDLRSIVYKAITCNCDNPTYESLFKLYHEADLQEEKLRIIGALGHTECESNLDRVLNFAFSEHVLSQDALQVIISAAVTRRGREKAWKFYKDNIKEIKGRYGSHGGAARLVQRINENFASEEMAEDVNRFFQENPYPGLEDTVYRAVEKIRTNAEWLKREDGPIKDYFASISLRS